MYEFYLNHLNFDQKISLGESERRTIISTGLNKQNIKPLAVQVLQKLIADMQGLSSEQYNTFIDSHQEDIFLLHSLFSFHSDITSVSTREKGGLTDLKSILTDIIQKGFIGDIQARGKRDILYALLREVNYQSLSQSMIQRFQDMEKLKSNDETQTKSTNIFLQRAPLGYDMLVFLRAHTVSKYLRSLKGGELQENTQTTVNEVLLLS